MNLGKSAATASARDRRRTILLTFGGLLVTAYILAPFCWLLLTSFMHEQDALSVPPQWIPKNPTLANYMTFLDPAGTRAIVGSRAAEQTFPGMVNSLIAATGTAVARKSAARMTRIMIPPMFRTRSCLAKRRASVRAPAAGDRR